ncbi:MAG: phosphoglucomutase/phosphomannomutase family protein [Firmicutes bacterium]|jgi:alpha-D-glucose phosphate-specific phosphoglucomutase|nr:phosphoglucomutase/phosphomannomutase family protein [Bacillota bacterium]
MNKIKFGTDGWRAVMCDEFTFANVRLVTQAIADHVGGRGTILVGHDTRFLAEDFAAQAAEVLIGNGIPVEIVKGDVPTPVLAHAVLQRGCQGGVMFTASHNPPKYNGIKFIPHYGGPADDSITRSIEANLARLTHEDVKRKPLAKGEDLLTWVELGDEYVDSVRTIVDFDGIARAGLRVVVDPMYGTGRKLLPRLLEEAGCVVDLIHADRDPLFGGLSPEPTEAQLQDLIRLVRENNAHLGLANDGDADRFGVIDTTGDFLSPNQVLVLLLAHLVENKGWRGDVVRTVATTHMLDRQAAHYGLTLHETPVGFKHICQLMLKGEVLIGGEESGGLSIGPHIPEKDGLLACLLLAELRAVEGKSLTAILGDIMEEVGGSYSARLDMHLPGNKKEELMAAARDVEGSWQGRRILRRIDVDGIKWIFADDSWCLIRPSGTEPLVRIYLEGADQEALEGLKKDALAFVDAL